jgi:hypothetical protein
MGLRHLEHVGGGGFLGMRRSRWIRREHRLLTVTD